MAEQLNFRKGLHANLLSAEIIPGSICITTDEPGMYLDLADADGVTNKRRVRIGDFVSVANLEAVATEAQKHAYSRSTLYYAEEENVLCKISEEGKFVWINDTTKIQENITTLQGTVSGHTTSIGANTKAIEENRAAIEKEVQDRTNAIAGVQSQIDAITGGTEGGEQITIADLVEQIAQEKTDRESADSAMNTRVTTLEGHFGTNGKVSVLENKVSTLEGKMSTAEDEIDDLQGEFAAGGRVSTAEGKITTLEGKMTSVEGTVSTQGNKINEAEKDIDNLQKEFAAGGRVSVVEGDVSTLKSQMGTAQTDISKNKEDIGKNTSAINGAVERITTAEGTISSLQTTVSAQGTNISKNAEDIGKNASAIADEIARATAEEARIAGLVSTETSRAEKEEQRIEGLVSSIRTDLNSEITRATKEEADIRSDFAEADAQVLQDAKDYVDDVLTAADAMTYKGIIGKNDSSTDLAFPTTGVKAGDTYVIDQGYTFANGKTYYAGDLVIAKDDQEGETYTGQWHIVNTGYVEAHESKMTVANNQIALTSHVAAAGSGDLGKVKFVASSDSNVTISTSGSNITIGMEWGSF